MDLAKNVTPVDISMRGAVRDPRNRVRVWGIPEKAWLWREPVDAKEMIAAGVASLEAPAEAPPPPAPEVVAPPAQEEPAAPVASAEPSAA